MGYGKSKYLAPALRWGRDNEPKILYLEDQQKLGEPMLFKSTGLHLLPEKPYLGASADGKLLYTSAGTCCIGCLENMPIQHRWQSNHFPNII